MLLLGMDNTVVVQKDHALVPSVPLRSSYLGWFMCFTTCCQPDWLVRLD